MDIVWGDIAANCRTASMLIDSTPGSDLYVLPEMFTTGFATQPESIADDSLTSMKWMQEKANKINAAICGSVATKCDDGTYHNRFYFVTPQASAIDSVQFDRADATTMPENSSSICFYDKRHLFTYGGEHLRYAAGHERIIVKWRDVRFLLQVCYDLRFPIFARNTHRATDKLINFDAPLYKDNIGNISSEFQDNLDITQELQDNLEQSDATHINKDAYDVAIYVASWPTSRIAPWHTLLKARAIENQCYVLGVGRIGTDIACKYCGGTEAIDAYGRIIAACPDNEQATITSAIDTNALHAFRKKFPVLNDTDNATVSN